MHRGDGWPEGTRKVGPHQYEFSIDLTPDEEGMLARHCPNPECSPREFKVQCGTGPEGETTHAICPYCRTREEFEAFITPAQQQYVNDSVSRIAVNRAQSMLTRAFGGGGRRKLGSGPFSMTIEVKSDPVPPVIQRPEAPIRRDLACPHCSLEHAVYGLAQWCPACGEDIFIAHVEAELAPIRADLETVDAVRQERGLRHAARVLDNALEDVVTAMEGALRYVVVRRLRETGRTREEVEATMGKVVGNRLQSHARACDVFRELFGMDLSSVLDEGETRRFGTALQKRHLVTHNLGIADARYLEKTGERGTVGRDATPTRSEVEHAMGCVMKLVQFAHGDGGG